MEEQLDQSGKYMIVNFYYLKNKAKITFVRFEKSFNLFISKELIRKFHHIFHGSFVGLALTGQTIDYLKREQEKYDIELKSMKYLSQKEISKNLIKERLIKLDKFNNSLIDEVFLDLEKKGFINEEKSIMDIIYESTQKRFWGPDRVKYYLINNRRYDEELVNYCIKKLGSNYFLEIADLAAKKFAKRSKKNTTEMKIEVKRRLVNRGFYEEVADTAILISGIKKDDNEALLRDLEKLKRKFQNVSGERMRYNKIVDNLKRKGYNYSKIDAVFPKEWRK